MDEAPAYDRAVADNITAARARRRLSQRSLAARMQALGFAWRQQIVATAESGDRRVTVGELLGLALALETTTNALLDPSHDDKLIELPSGDVILARTVLRSNRNFNDGMISWNGDSPRFATREPAAWPDTPLKDEMRDAGLMEFSSEDMIERNARLHPEPAGGWPEPEPPSRRQQPVVAAIVTSGKGVLIGRRNDGDPPWTFIAGEVEPGEQPEDAAIREVKEETGCEIRPGRIIGRRVHPKTGRAMIYVSAKPVHGTEIFVGDEAELAEVRWASFGEAAELLPGMYAPVRKYLSRELASSAESGDRA